MKNVFITLTLLLTLGLAQTQLPFAHKQLWQISEGEHRWVIALETHLNSGNWEARIVSGEIPKDHSAVAFVNPLSESQISFDVHFNDETKTDSGSGFKCLVTFSEKTPGGTFSSYISTVAGPQWSEETSSCRVEQIEKSQ
jgi:hypothetical protein